MEEGTALGKAFENMEPDPPRTQAAEKPVAPVPAANPDAASTTPPPDEKKEDATGATGADAQGVTPPSGAAVTGSPAAAEQPAQQPSASEIAAPPAVGAAPHQGVESQVAGPEPAGIDPRRPDSEYRAD